MIKRPIILASGSPRRAQLMEEAGLNFWVQKTDCEENYSESLAVYEIAEYLANQKADAAYSFITTADEIVITADSVVALGGAIYGKPADEKDAYRILCFLSGKIHTVYTGVCLMDKDRRVSFTSKTEVFFREFSHDEIQWYISKYKPFDKAGSYGIQEWIGLCKISRIEGSYSNVMGLPMDLVYEGLLRF
ncbi:MAG: Maf family protein [Saprospiraceae bacterium]